MKKIIGFLLLGLTLSANLSAKSLKDLASNAAKKTLENESKSEETSQAISLTNDLALYAFLKGTNADLSEEYLPYAQVMEYEVWKKYHNDPFEWEEKFAQCKKNFDEKIANVNPNQEYVIMTSIEFDDYDFENQGYKVEINDGTYFPMDSVFFKFGTYNAYPGDNSYFVNKIGLKLQDLSKYNFIPMEKETAKTFLQSRKSSSGNINKKITIMVKYKLADFNSKEYNDFAALIANEGRIPLVGIIQDPIEVYDANKNYQKIGELTIK